MSVQMSVLWSLYDSDQYQTKLHAFRPAVIFGASSLKCAVCLFLDCIMS